MSVELLIVSTAVEPFYQQRAVLYLTSVHWWKRESSVTEFDYQSQIKEKYQVLLLFSCTEELKRKRRYLFPFNWLILVQKNNTLTT